MAQPHRFCLLVPVGAGQLQEQGRQAALRSLEGQVADLAPRRKAEEGNDTHVAAPMPGAVSVVSVIPGMEVKAGDVLMTIEAMKMETVLHAHRDGTVAEVVVQPGQQIEAKDLLLVLQT